MLNGSQGDWELCRNYEYDFNRLADAHQEKRRRKKRSYEYVNGLANKARVPRNDDLTDETKRRFREFERSRVLGLSSVSYPFSFVINATIEQRNRVDRNFYVHAYADTSKMRRYARNAPAVRKRRKHRIISRIKHRKWGVSAIKLSKRTKALRSVSRHILKNRNISAKSKRKVNREQ